MATGTGLLVAIRRTASAALGVDLPLVRWLAVRFLWTGGVELIAVDSWFTAVPGLRASLGTVLRRRSPWFPVSHCARVERLEDDDEHEPAKQ